MKILRLLLTGVLLLLSQDAAAQDESTPPKIGLGSTILLIGDSLGVGLGAEFKERARAAGYTPVTHSVGGTVAAQWIPWLKHDLSRYRPQLVVVSLGTNDVAASIQWIRNHSDAYFQLVREANVAGAQVVWIGTPKLSRTKFPHADEVREIIRSSIESPYFESQKLDLPQTDDKIHSTIKGYKIWMDAVWDWMAQQNIVKNHL